MVTRTGMPGCRMLIGRPGNGPLIPFFLSSRLLKCLFDFFQFFSSTQHFCFVRYFFKSEFKLKSLFILLTMKSCILFTNKLCFWRCEVSTATIFFFSFPALVSSFLLLDNPLLLPGTQSLLNQNGRMRSVCWNVVYPERPTSESAHPANEKDPSLWAVRGPSSPS